VVKIWKNGRGVISKSVVGGGKFFEKVVGGQKFHPLSPFLNGIALTM